MSNNDIKKMEELVYVNKFEVFLKRIQFRNN